MKLHFAFLDKNNDDKFIFFKKIDLKRSLFKKNVEYIPNFIKRSKEY